MTDRKRLRTFLGALATVMMLLGGARPGPVAALAPGSAPAGAVLEDIPCETRCLIDAGVCVALAALGYGARDICDAYGAGCLYGCTLF